MAKTILYIHGLGGGEDSRIPNLLSAVMPDCNIVIKTYSFDPEAALKQIQSLVEEFHPSVIVGESWGANLALCIPDIPVILVSPGLGVPRYFAIAAPLCRIKPLRAAFERKYQAKDGRRQTVSFEPSWLKKWPYFRQLSINTPHPAVQAFFGSRDHYRPWGIVNINNYRRRYGDTYTIYDGSHFMEEAYVYSDLVPAIRVYL